MGWWFRLGEGSKKLLLVWALALLTAGVFAQVLYFPFISYDDNFFVGTGTPMAAGVSWGDSGTWRRICTSTSTSPSP